MKRQSEYSPNEAGTNPIKTVSRTQKVRKRSKYHEPTSPAYEGGLSAHYFHNLDWEISQYIPGSWTCVHCHLKRTRSFYPRPRYNRSRWKIWICSDISYLHEETPLVLGWVPLINSTRERIPRDDFYTDLRAILYNRPSININSVWIIRMRTSLHPAQR